MTQNVPIRIFNSDLELLGEVDDYENLYYTRNLNSAGSFIITISTYSENSSLLVKNNIIMIGGETYRCGIIKSRDICLNQDGKKSEFWTISGYSLSGLFKQRITVPDATYDTISYTGYAEDVMRNLVDKCCINANDTDRNITGLQLNTSNSLGTSMTYKSRYAYLSDELNTIALVDSLGFYVEPDFEAQTMSLVIYEGVDRTYGNGVNSNVIFTPEYDSVMEQCYSDSDMDMKNRIYIAGQGEGALRDVDVVDGTFNNGFDLQEYFVDARDLSTTAEMLVRANSVLADLSTQEFVSCTANNFSSFSYIDDWDLGDFITIQNVQWNVLVDAQIVSVTQSWDEDGEHIEVEIGSQYPNIFKKLSTKFKNSDVETRK